MKQSLFYIRNELCRRSMALTVATAVAIAAVTSTVHAQTGILPPEAVPPLSGAEYYPPSADKKLLIAVNIWGEVPKPGVYYVPVNSSTRYTLSLAGGPGGLAKMPDVKKVSADGSAKYIDLLTEGNQIPVSHNDTIVVERSWVRADLAPALGILSTLLGIISVSLAIRSNN